MQPDSAPELPTAPNAAIPVIAAFYVATIFAPSHRMTLLFTGTVAIIACWTIAGRRGVDPAAGGEMIWIFVASAMVIAMPVAARAPIPLPTALAMGLGILALESIWAARCLPVFPRSPLESLLSRSGKGVLLGVAMALILSLFATVPLTVAYFAGAPERMEIRELAPLLYGGYLLGGAAAGLLAGLLQPLSRWPLGTMLIGMLAGVCVYGAVGPFVELTDGKAISWPRVIGIALACGVLAGPPGALAWRYGAGAATSFEPLRSWPRRSPKS